MAIIESALPLDTHTENSRQVSPFALEKQVQSGLEFILGHFSEPLWPRRIMTAATVVNGTYQCQVDSKEEALVYFKDASYKDCRINAFGIGQTNPDLLFFDIDACKFCSTRSLKLALNATLKNIKQKLEGYPTVYESGSGGYHVLQPISCSISLEEIKELADLEPDISKEFLQFAERYLSNGKSDKSNNPSLRSCLIRVPSTFNSKNNAQVKIIQRWDGYRPDFMLLMGSFCAYLVGENNNNNKSKSSGIHYDIRASGITEPYIEKLIRTAINDHRKHARDLMIIPYLVLRKGLTDTNQICDIIMQWADKCNQLRRLQPSRREFEKKIYIRIKEVMRDRVPHMGYNVMKEKYPDLAERIKLTGGA